MSANFIHLGSSIRHSCAHGQSNNALDFPDFPKLQVSSRRLPRLRQKKKPSKEVSMEIQVCTLAGDLHNFELELHIVAGDFQKLIAERFNIPSFQQKLLWGDQLLTLKSSDRVSGLGIPPGTLVTLVKINRVWFWADFSGANPCTDILSGLDQGIAYNYTVLESLFDWVKPYFGADFASADPTGAGVVYIPNGELPKTSAEMLHFLSGGQGNHLPVISELICFEDDELCSEENQRLCPWIDIEELACESIQKLWPPPFPMDDSIWVPGLSGATAALMCADEALSRSKGGEKELHRISKQCRFFACMGNYKGSLKPEANRSGFFKPQVEASITVASLTPWVIVCANPLKSTIAFSYQISYFSHE